MNITMLQTNSIVPNEYNPNVVEENIMEQLYKDIERVGIKQPVIVRRHPTHRDRYIIVDGEHRWKAATHLKINDVPCEIVEIDENEAKIMTITMNRLRGEFDSIKLAEVIRSLKDVYTMEDLEERLGYNAEQLQSYDDLLDFNFEKLSEEDTDITAAISNIDHSEGLLNEFTLPLNLHQLEIVEAAIAHVEETIGTRAESLTHICEMFLENNNVEALREINDRQKALDNLEKKEEDGTSEEAEEKAIL